MAATTWYRRRYWLTKGNRQFTKSGFEAAAPYFHPDDLDVDCTGRHCLVTGGDHGLGYQACHELAKRGAVIHMVSTDLRDAKAARVNIVSETGNDKIHLYALDLSKPYEVSEFCRQFLSRQQSLHALLNCAEVLENQRKVDEDGIEYNFAVNTLAVHLLTTSLVPLLQKSADSRVVTVSSADMLLVRLDPEDLMSDSMDPFEGSTAYSQNKRQQVALTLNYAQNFEGVHFSSLNPGWVDTPFTLSTQTTFYEPIRDKLRSPLQGADTLLWLTIAERATSSYSSGLFFQDREPVSTHLPLAWTRTTAQEENLFVENLNKIVDRLFSTQDNSIGTEILHNGSNLEPGNLIENSGVMKGDQGIPELETEFQSAETEFREVTEREHELEMDYREEGDKLEDEPLGKKEWENELGLNYREEGELEDEPLEKKERENELGLNYHELEDESLEKKQNENEFGLNYREDGVQLENEPLEKKEKENELGLNYREEGDQLKDQPLQNVKGMNGLKLDYDKKGDKLGEEPLEKKENEFGLDYREEGNELKDESLQNVKGMNGLKLDYDKEGDELEAEGINKIGNEENKKERNI